MRASELRRVGDLIVAVTGSRMRREPVYLVIGVHGNSREEQELGLRGADAIVIWPDGGVRCGAGKCTLPDSGTTRWRSGEVMGSTMRSRRVGDLVILVPEVDAVGERLEEGDWSAYIVLGIPDGALDDVLGTGMGFAVGGRVGSVLVSPVGVVGEWTGTVWEVR